MKYYIMIDHGDFEQDWSIYKRELTIEEAIDEASDLTKNGPYVLDCDLLICADITLDD